MAVAYGDFDSMALCFTKRLAEGEMKAQVFFDDMEKDSYGVCDIPEMAKLQMEKGYSNIRPMCCMDRQEFMMLLFIRYRDLIMKVEEDVKGAQ